MMVTRVSILVLVTGLFAGMWSADSPDERSLMERQLARHASSPCAVGDRPIRTARRQVSLSPQPGTLPVALPRGIAPGTYLVVNQSGESRTVTIPANSRGRADSAGADQYTVRSGSQRWHFIRLETEQSPTRRQVMAASLH